jgi:hypothetical protein
MSSLQPPSQKDKQPLRPNRHIGPEMEALLLRIDLREEVESQRGLKAIALAPTLPICRALLAGERVHCSQLHAPGALRYGLRRRNSDDRYCLDDFNDVRGPAPS